MTGNASPSVVARVVLLVLLGALSATFLVMFVRNMWAVRHSLVRKQVWISTLVSAVLTFFDTLGIGSYAPTTASFKTLRLLPDREIPGTLTVGYISSIWLQATIFVTVIEVEWATLTLLIASATAGAWFGAGLVPRLNERAIRVCLLIALCVGAVMISWQATGGQAVAGVQTGLRGAHLVIAIIATGVLGALMTAGIGLYAPCIVLLSLLGMDPFTAFPIMMGACAFLMPVAGFRFLRMGAYSPSVSLGLSMGGPPAVLVGAFLITRIELVAVRWIMVAAIVLAGAMTLRQLLRSRAASTRD